MVKRRPSHRAASLHAHMVNRERRLVRDVTRWQRCQHHARKFALDCAEALSVEVVIVVLLRVVPFGVVVFLFSR